MHSHVCLSLYVLGVDIYALNQDSTMHLLHSLKGIQRSASIRFDFFWFASRIRSCRDTNKTHRKSKHDYGIIFLELQTRGTRDTTEWLNKTYRYHMITAASCRLLNRHTPSCTLSCMRRLLLTDSFVFSHWLMFSRVDLPGWLLRKRSILLEFRYPLRHSTDSL